jgi:hypothetical protein
MLKSVIRKAALRGPNTPGGRALHYVEPASGTKDFGFRPVKEIFG